MKRKLQQNNTKQPPAKKQKKVVPFPFFQLSTDVRELVIVYLEPTDVFHLLLVNKQMQQFLYASALIWRHLLTINTFRVVEDASKFTKRNVREEIEMLNDILADATTFENEQEKQDCILQKLEAQGKLPEEERPHARKCTLIYEYWEARMDYFERRAHISLQQVADWIRDCRNDDIPQAFQSNEQLNTWVDDIINKDVRNFYW